ncbi:MAG: DNA alkylation repair protein, partial [Propionibacteriaceae bacterium]|nr:DNA alkylation repair protein [Propionibacteriaceae bacterium]
MELFDTLRAAADPARAEPMAAYMRHRFPYLGIPTPERRRLSRPFLQALGKAPLDWDFVATCWGEPEREFQYVGVDYLAGVKARLTPADVPRLAGLITSKSWWDTVDGLDAIVGDIARRYPVVNDTLLAWSTDDNIWLRRAAIDHQLLRKTATGTDLLERIIVNN